MVLVVATVCSAAILAAWFPASNLLHQRSQLAAASTQLNRLDRQNAALRHREKQLRTPTTLGRIAQQQYDLVPPGEQAYQVLPPSGSGNADGSFASTPTRAGGSGGAGTGSHGTAGRAVGGPGSGSSAGTSGSFLGRVLRTLEFWR